MAKPARTNILLIHSDQHRFDCVGSNGHPLVRTPNLDRLAEAGANFQRAYTPIPICSPARASLMTGTWPSTHDCLTIPGCCETFHPARDELPNLYRLGSAVGYRIGHIGKFHQEVSGSPTDHGAERFVGAGEYRRWREAEGLPPVPTGNGLFGETDPHIEAGQSALAWQADQVLSTLDDFAATAGERPFFLRWDPPEPHLPNRVPEPYASMVSPESIEPWPSFPDPLEGKPLAQRKTRQRWGTDDWSWEQWQPVVARYLGEISLMDAQIGRVLERLEALGLADDTLVIYSTDHGDMCGGHGMMDKHYCLYEDIVHVPLILRFPGRVAGGVRCEALTLSEIDLARTLIDAMGVEAPESFAGRNLIATACGELPARDSVLIQYFGTQQGLFSERGLIDERFKYVYNPAAEDELYDLANDPGELKNLATAAEQADRLQAMRERMGEWMAEVGDRLSPPLFDWRTRGRGK